MAGEARTRQGVGTFGRNTIDFAINKALAATSFAGFFGASMSEWRRADRPWLEQQFSGGHYVAGTWVVRGWFCARGSERQIGKLQGTVAARRGGLERSRGARLRRVRRR